MTEVVLARPDRLHERLGDVLARDIVAGRLVPGSAFPSTDQLVRRHDVSRTVAREVAQALASAGLIEVRHGRRTVVADPDDWHLLTAPVQAALRAEGLGTAIARDAYELRLALEPLAAARCAGRTDDALVAALRALGDDLARLRGGGDRAPFLRVDAAFHGAIVHASGNRLVREVHGVLAEVGRTIGAIDRLRPGDAFRVVEQHGRITDAIAARDPVAAEAAMRAHLEWAAAVDLR